jgi:glycosyltransferase involved in cell wall biosynthesis
MSYQAFESWRDGLVATPTLSVVIPTYNEAIRILPTIAAISVSVSALNIPWELIVSDDGSSDGTAALLEALPWKNLRVLRHTNTGKGGAVQRGVLAAYGELVLFADADNSTPIQELPRLLKAIQNGSSIAIGSRAAVGAQEMHKSMIRRAVSGFFRGLIFHGLRLRVHDTQCGFKLFKRETVHLFRRQHMLGFSFDLELLYLARKFGHGVAEIPVRWIDAPGSKVNGLRDSLRFSRDMIRILVNDHLLHRYERAGVAILEPQTDGGR